MKFVDVKNDIAFRKIFGNENKKEILVSFLNAVLGLPAGKRIREVEILNPFQLPEVKGLKSSILDIRATDERRVSYIVEMQVEELDGFDKRVQYYTAKQYSSQISTGDDYPKLDQVIFIGILDFVFFEDDPSYLTRHRTVNLSTRKATLDGMEYNFMELAKFDKSLERCESLVDKWAFFLKHAADLSVIPSGVEDEGLRRAYEDAARHNWTKADLEAYHYAEMRRQDERGKTTVAVRKAVEKAVKEAFSQAVEQEQAKHMKEKIEMAQKGIIAGYPNEMLATVTGFTEAQLDEIRKQLKRP